jgi:alkanesulfonate monooxygenase SsuD/methylene tetrahydromethanopterin reductase-like flavin-dependent oxidoreductase (luciferase family)
MEEHEPLLPVDLHHYDLHLWLFKPNPSGLFQPVNPEVKCPTTGFSLPALKRVAKEADGWFPVGIPISGLAQMFEGIQGMAREAGRDPAALELIVRANLEISDTMRGRDRTDFTGTLEQIADDVVARRKLGATELLFDVQVSPGVEAVDDIVARMEQLWEISKVT